MPGERFPVDVSLQDCRAVAACLDFMLHVVDCCDVDREMDAGKLRVLRQRFLNAIAIEEEFAGRV